MKFDIRITFDGLYLLTVQDEPRLLHALLVNFGEDVPYDADPRHPGMPANGGHGNGHSGRGHAARADAPAVHSGNGNSGMNLVMGEPPRHYPMIYFDAAHLALNESERTEMTGHPFGVSLKDRFLQIGRPGDNTPPDLNLDPRIIGLNTISDAQSIDKAVLGLRPGRVIAGRVTLASGAQRPVPKDHTEKFEVIPAGATEPTKKVTIATRIEWDITNVEGVNVNTFPLELRDIETGELVTTHVLRPVTTYELAGGEPKEKNLIRLHVYCAGSRDLPGGAVIHPLQRGATMPHFDAFFQLFPNVVPPTLRATEITRTGSTEQCTGMRIPLG